MYLPTVDGNTYGKIESAYLLFVQLAFVLEETEQPGGGVRKPLFDDLFEL